MKQRKRMLSTLLCLLLCLVTALSACVGPIDNGPSTTAAPETDAETDAETEAKKVSYSVIVKTESGALVKGVQLQVSNGETSLPTAVTDANGIATFELDETDSILTYRVKVSQLPTGYTAEADKEYSFPTNSKSLVITVAAPDPDPDPDPEITYTVIVKTESGTLVSGARLQVFKEDQALTSSLTTQSNGSASFNLLQSTAISDCHVKILQLPYGYVGDTEARYVFDNGATSLIIAIPNPPSPYPFEIEDCGTTNAPGHFHMATRTDRADFIDALDLNGTIINDAVYERNLLIEDLFNVEITMFEAGDSLTTEYNANITADIMGNIGAYDCTQSWSGSGLENQGYYMNLLSFPELDLANDPWWIDSWHESSILYDCLFTCNGDLQFELYDNAVVLYFNKTIAEGLAVADEDNLPIGMLVYNHVDSKTWTMNQLDKYANIAAFDVNGNGFHTKYERGYESSQDIFGSLLNTSVLTPAMFALGAKYSGSSNGSLTFSFNDSRNFDAFEKLYVMVNDTDYNFMPLTTMRGKESYELFTDGHALFCWSDFRNATRINESGVSYGLLPLPMLAEGGDYATTAYTHSYFAFLTTTPDFHKSALVFNAMNALSTELLYEDYFDEYLGFDAANDPDSARMIPLICNSLYFDFAWIHPNFSANAGQYFDCYIMEKDPSIRTKMMGFDNMGSYLSTIYQVYHNTKLQHSRS